MSSKEITTQNTELQNVLDEQYKMEIDKTDITIPTLQIIQKVSQIATADTEGKIIVKDFDAEVADKVKIVVLGYKKYYFVWNSQGDEVLSVVPLTANLEENKIELKNGKYVYTEDPTANIIYTYVYEIIVIINGKQTIAKWYLRKSGLATAKKINSIMVQLNSRIFDLTTVEKAKGNLKWYVFDATSANLTDDEVKKVGTALKLYNKPKEADSEKEALEKETPQGDNYEEIPF